LGKICFGPADDPSGQLVVIRFLLAFLIVLERMPGKRGSNGRGGRREKAAIRKKASRSRCAESDVVAVAEKLAWSRSMARGDVDLLASEGFDTKMLEKIKNESATCACAFCGMIIFGDSKMRHARDVAEVFSSTAPWPRFSARGVATSKFIAPVIQDLVSKDGQLFSCETCEDIYQACAKAREDKELVAIPPRFSLDFGSRVGLPELSLVEKAAVAINRMYGKVVKIKHNMGAGTPSNLCGHLINFRHSGPDSVSKVLPNTDVDQLIVVHFIGGNQKWERMMPLLEGGPFARMWSSYGCAG
jgi:hypothetical protein